MKVGGIDVTIPTLVYLALCVVIAIVDLRLYVSKSSQRKEGYFAPTISQALSRTTPNQEAYESCRSLIAIYPDNAAPRMYLGQYQFRNNEFEDAKKTFLDIAELKSVKPDEAAAALVAAGCSNFQQELGKGTTQKERADAALKSRSYFEKALAADKSSGDARTALALCTFWEKTNDPAAVREVINALTEVLDGKSAPSVEGTIQAYLGLGAAFTSLGKGEEAKKVFTSVIALRPQHPSAIEGINMAGLANIMSKEISTKDRDANFDKVKSTLNSYGAREPQIAILLAQSMLMGRSGRPFASHKDTYFPKINSLLVTEESKFPDYVELYYTHLAAYEDILFGDPADPALESYASQLAPELFEFGTGIEGQSNPWLNSKIFQGDVGTNSGGVQKNLMVTMLVVIREARAIITNLEKRGKLSPQQITDIELRKLRLSVFEHGLSATDEQKASLGAVLEEEFKKYTDANAKDATALRMAGLFALRQRHYEVAGDYLKRATNAGGKKDNTIDLLGSLKQPPTFFDLRPRSNGVYGNLPIFSVTVAPQTPGKIKVEMSSSGKPIAETLQRGTQIIYAPAAGATSSVEVKATDAMGNEAKQALSLNSDLRPPTISVEAADSPNPKRPIWKIVMKDKKGGGDDDDEGSGVDRSSIKITLTKAGTINAGFKPQVLVSEGKYQDDSVDVKLANRNAVKKGDAIDDDTFKVQASVDLEPGNYQLRVEVSDKAANKATQSIPFQVK